MLVDPPGRTMFLDGELTRGETLLQLVRLLRVFEDECVKVPAASDLEFDLLRGFVPLDMCSCYSRASAINLRETSEHRVCGSSDSRMAAIAGRCRRASLQRASFLRQISMKRLISAIS